MDGVSRSVRVTVENVRVDGRREGGRSTPMSMQAKICRGMTRFASSVVSA